MSTFFIKATALNNLCKLAKILKTDLIYVSKDGLVCGVDDDITYLNILEGTKFFESQFPIIIKTLELKSLLKNNTKEYITVEYNDNYFLSSDPDTLKSYIYLQYKIDSLIDKANMINNFTPVTMVMGLESNTEFRSILKLKAANGARSININGYIMFLFKSLFSINSADSVSLKIYDNNTNDFVAVFNIFKSGMISINQYIRFIKL